MMSLSSSLLFSQRSCFILKHMEVSSGANLFSSIHGDRNFSNRTFADDSSVAAAIMDSLFWWGGFVEVLLWRNFRWLVVTVCVGSFWIVVVVLIGHIDYYVLVSFVSGALKSSIESQNENEIKLRAGSQCLNRPLEWTTRSNIIYPCYLPRIWPNYTCDLWHFVIAACSLLCHCSLQLAACTLQLALCYMWCLYVVSCEQASNEKRDGVQPSTVSIASRGLFLPPIWWIQDSDSTSQLNLG